MAATGICALCLLYAAKRALKTSVVSIFRVQLCEFDPRYNLVSELEAEVLKVQT